MSEVDDRMTGLERWCAALDEELDRLRRVLLAIGIVAAQAERRTQDE